MTFLFIATIGPVQPFIASARRTRDLYAGSTLLSELSKAAALKIVEQAGGDLTTLIFPAPADVISLTPGTLFNVANKIVAEIKQAPGQVETLGENVRKAIHDQLFAVWEDALREKEAPRKIQLVDEGAAHKQLENLLEYSWVAVNMLDYDNNYKEAREQAEAILGARKNTHFFRAVTWGATIEKSSIDGERECVIPDTYYGSRRDKDREAKARSLYNIYKAGPYERLSAVDLLKRLAWRAKEQRSQLTPLPLMLSTSHIAATPFLERLGKLDEGSREDARKLWNTYLRQVELLAPSSIIEYIQDERMPHHPVIENVDGALLFKERLLDDTDDGTKLPPVNAALGAFFSFTDQHLAGLRPSPYYAILLADGDGMGKAIDKQAEQGPEGRKGPEGHQAISQALAHFAKQIRGVVDDRYHGSLVYAGGDDVLALLPLHTVLACAEELHAIFHTTLSTFEDEEGHSPTLSVGIAVVHHISLLQEALEVARAAERKAKDYRGTDERPAKNALAILVKKRGGEQNETVVSWHDQEAEFHLLITLYNANIIPVGMAYELRTMMQRLQPSRRDQQDTNLQQIVQIEAARILRRKLYFSQNRVKQEDTSMLEQELSTHLNSYEISEEMRKKLKKPQDKARYILLRQIAVKESVSGEFEVLHAKDITSFISSLIVAQAFTEVLKPASAQGVAE